MTTFTKTLNEKNQATLNSEKTSQTDSANHTFLYVSNNRNDQRRFAKNLASVFCADHLKQAKRLLTLLHKLHKLPDTIMLDLPFSEKEIFDFVLWIHSNKWSYAIPVVYNQKRLTLLEFNKLHELNITDEILNLEIYLHRDQRV